jgi:CheY-like chemotaxis protein
LGCRERPAAGIFAEKAGRRRAKSWDFAPIQDRTVNKTALIVDDSRSARVVLKKVLETHELNVDTAESAEDALDYLTDHRPDVIFMDHLMPGMDGFEAVSAIKQNPDTATIPIMMYTSQEGEVYVGQARALGAVGVLPKKIAPVEVSKVLKSLRVIGGEDMQTSVPDETGTTSISGEFAALETLDQDLRLLIKGLFEQQRAVLRRDMLDSYEAIATRVADEIRPEAEEELAESPPADDPTTSVFTRTAIIVLTMITMVFAWLYWQREQSWQDMQAQNLALQRAVENQRASEAQDSLQVMQQMDNYQDSLASMYAAAISSLEWGANQAAQYDFGEAPLGDDRLTIVEQLTSQLEAIDFSGLVRIETHVADYCLAIAGEDGYSVSADAASAAACDSIGFSPGEAYELGLEQSVSFANFIRLANERNGGRIRYEIVSLGNSDPLMPYPLTADGVTAGAWNRIAAANQRVEISLVPDTY